MDFPHFISSQPLRAVQSLYLSTFNRATKQCWNDNIVSHEMLSAVLRQIYDTMKYDQSSLAGRLEHMKQLPAPDLCSFGDYVDYLRRVFSGLDGELASFPARAILQKAARIWTLPIEPEDLQLCKGLGSHLAEGKSMKESTEVELAGLFLRPSLEPDQLVIHVGTEQFGRLCSKSMRGWIWQPIGCGSIQDPIFEEDKYALLPLAPHIATLAFDRPLPPLNNSDIWAEFRAVFPYCPQET